MLSEACEPDYEDDSDPEMEELLAAVGAENLEGLLDWYLEECKQAMGAEEDEQQKAIRIHEDGGHAVPLDPKHRICHACKCGHAKDKPAYKFTRSPVQRRETANVDLLDMLFNDINGKR